MDDPRFQQPAATSQVPQTSQVTKVLDAILFDRAAMLMGRSLYWNTSPRDHVAGIETLLRWCLALPDAQLGISVTGVLQIVQSLVTAAPGLLTPEIAKLLERYSVELRSLPVFRPDELVWATHLDTLAGWLGRASRPDDYIWLDGPEAERWIAATMQSLAQYSQYIDSNTPASIRLQVMSRHVCAIFAPFDGATMWNRMSALATTLKSPQKERLENLLSNPQFTRDKLASITSVFWTWRPLNFADADGSIICTPMLGLWNGYPSSAHWAPPSLTDIAPRAQYSTDEVARLLVDVYWQVLETLFNAIRQSCGLGVAEPEFNEIETRPPVFFFASPVTPPVLPEEYAGTLRRAIYPLIKSCLLSNDPLADQIAWGLLEGDLVALRREMSSRRYYQSRYLVLPTISKSDTAGPIEDGVGGIADQLTYLEFSMGHEARDVYTDMDPLAVRSGLWGGTMDGLGQVTGQALDLLPALGQGDAKRVFERLAQLNLVLRRVQALVEKGASDSNQVQTTYKAYLDGTDDFMRRTLTVSSVPHSSVLSLRDAVLNAYPYQYVKQPLESLQNTIQLLSTIVGRISGSLNTVLEQADRDARNRQSRSNGILSVLLALVGLLVGLLQVVGSQFSKSGSTTTPTGVVAQLFQLPTLNTVAQELVTLVSLGVVVASLTYVVTLFYQRLRKQLHRFVVGVQRLRGLVEQATQHAVQVRKLDEALALAVVAALSASSDERAAVAAVESLQRQIADGWARIDGWDSEAADVLAQLWKDLRQLTDKGEDASRRSARDWVDRARALEHMIELFDLSPQIVPLPRVLCVLRFKSTEFLSSTTVSDRDFESSLGLLKFSPLEVAQLDQWLSALGNPKQIKDWDVATFTRVLKERGVSASPRLRKPDLWQDSLEDADKVKASRS